MILVRHERHRRNRCAEQLAPLFKREGSAGLGQGSGDEAHADRRFQAGREAATGNAPDLVALGVKNPGTLANRLPAFNGEADTALHGALRQLGKNAGGASEPALRAAARAGIDEVAAAVPSGIGEQIVSRVRGEVWGRPVEGAPDVVAGGAFAVIGVSMNPGCTMLTRMPRGPSSVAATCVRPRSPHLLVV